MKRIPALFLLTVVCLVPTARSAETDWHLLFDGKSLNGWKAAEDPATWTVVDGCLVAKGPRSHLFYTGPIANHDFRNFELEAELKTGDETNSGIYFHTAYQESGWPNKGYEVQVNNSHPGSDKYREFKQTGSLYGVRNVYKSAGRDGQWFTVRIRVEGNRVRIWVNGFPTVDYLQPETPFRKLGQKGRVLNSGTIALQGHDPASRVAYRRVAIRLLPDDVDPGAEPRASDTGYGVHENLLDKIAAMIVPFIDYHVHLRGGMSVEKAMDRQAVSGINQGVLRNQGTGWPLENDKQLAEFLDSATGRPVFVGIQVNDRDWYTHHDRKLLGQLDFVLGDTMIMPMPNDDSPPVKLFQPDKFTIDDPEAWMKRYVKHHLLVLSEPITILANPTWLPEPVVHLYDQLWTDERMALVIQAAIDNNVALEINAGSGYPRERFIRMAKKMGAKFTFGSNNFDDKPHDMTRCFESIEQYDLTKADMYVPSPK